MKVDHWQHIALLIQAQIDILEGKFDEDEPEMLEDSDVSSSSSQEFHNIVLGAKQNHSLFQPLSQHILKTQHSKISENDFVNFFQQHSHTPREDIDCLQVNIHPRCDGKLNCFDYYGKIGSYGGCRFRSSDTSKSPMSPKLPGKLLLIIFAAIPISKRSHAMTASLSTPPWELYSPD